MRTIVTSLPDDSGAATFTDNATGTPVAVHESPNGEFQFNALGTFGSGTLVLQGSTTDTGSDWLPITSASLTAAGYVTVKAFFRRVRAVLTGATDPSITATVSGVRTGVTRTDPVPSP